MNWVAFYGLGIDKIYFYPYITIFGFKIYWYGIIITCAILVALFYASKTAGKFGIDKSKLLDIVLLGIIGGIIGARAYYVIFSWNDFYMEPLSVFDLRSGGLAIYGGIFGALIAGFIGCRWKKVPFLPMLDLAALGFLLGQGIGRWGNFVNVEAYGGHTDLPWGMSGSNIPVSISPVHPTFLYESLWCILGFVLLNLYVKHRKFDGEIALIYLMWYGSERAVVESLRTDSLWLIPGVIKVSMLVSIILAVGALIIFLYMYHRIKRPKKRTNKKSRRAYAGRKKK